jgi:hypothetical protein
VCRVVWAGVCILGSPWGSEEVGQGVTGGEKYSPLGENPHVGRCDGWGSLPFVRCGPQQRRVVCGAEPNGCGGAVRQADTPYGTQPRVGIEPLCRLGFVRLS